MRPDELYLHDILAASLAIERFLAGVDELRFHSDELLQAAVLQKLTVIGEAAARISRDFKQQHTDVEWRTIVGLRNVAVHEYFAISWATIWSTCTGDVPVLRSQVETALRKSDP